MKTPLEVVAHCLEQSQRLVNSVRVLLDLAKLSEEEPDVELCNSILHAAECTLTQAIGFHQSARITVQRLMKQPISGETESGKGDQS